MRYFDDDTDPALAADCLKRAFPLEEQLPDRMQNLLDQLRNARRETANSGSRH